MLNALPSLAALTSLLRKLSACPECRNGSLNLSGPHFHRTQ